MTESEQNAALSPDDMAKLREGKFGMGCLALLLVAMFIIGLAILLIIPVPILLLLYAVLCVGVTILFFVVRSRTNGAIEQDITGGQKRVIVGPIEKKRIAASEVRRGVNRGSIKSKYYMIIKAREYWMSEEAYLRIRAGEFIEIEEGPVSKKVISQRWMKEDGTSEALELR
jgi:hypothetical protein